MILVRRDSQLTQHQLVEMEVRRVFDCSLECIRQRTCVSFNFQRIELGRKGLCQLNDLLAEEHPSALQARVGFHYYKLLD